MALNWHSLFLVLSMFVFVKEISGAMICEADVRKHPCTGQPNVPIYECTVPNVYSIIDIDIHQETGQSTGCAFHPGAIPDTWTEDMGGVYTFAGDVITVAGGCRAVFEVEFNICVNENPPPCNGTIKRHGCSANYDTDIYECEIPNANGVILNVSIFNMVTKKAACQYYSPEEFLAWTPADGGAYSHSDTSVIMAGGCRAVVDVCLSGPPSDCEGKSIKHGACARNANEEYFNCTLPHVYSIINVEVHQQTSQDANCTFHEGPIPFDWDPAMGGIYGFQDNTIEVAGGCRAVFEVDFDVCVNENETDCEGGEWKKVNCMQQYSGNYTVCTANNVGAILFASIYNQISATECVFYPSPIPAFWTPEIGGAYTFYGNQITVAGGCRANFDVCGSALESCVISGDPHIKTADGRHLTFSGVCSYLLLQHGDFDVIGEFVSCVGGRRSCLKSITIEYEGHAVKLARRHKLFVDGSEATIPYSSADTPGVSVMMSEDQLRTVAVLTNGMSVEWDGKKRAVIYIPDVYMVLTRGLCGNFNQDPSDDFMLPDGTIVENHNDFGNGWKMNPTCPDV